MLVVGGGDFGGFRKLVPDTIRDRGGLEGGFGFIAGRLTSSYMLRTS